MEEGKSPAILRRVRLQKPASYRYGGTITVDRSTFPVIAGLNNIFSKRSARHLEGWLSTVARPQANRAAVAQPMIVAKRSALYSHGSVVSRDWRVFFFFNPCRAKLARLI